MVTVIGAGPAGAASAISLSMAGLAVTLVSPKRQPEKAAPDFQTLTHGALASLRRLGITSDRLADVAMPVERFAVTWAADSDQRVSSMMSSFSSVIVDRHKLDSLLDETASQSGAIRVFDSVSSIERSGGSDGRTWTINLESGLRSTSTIVIDASGRSAQFVRKAGVRLRMIDNLVACVLQGVDVPSSAQTEVHIEALDDGWLYTASDGVAPPVYTWFADGSCQSSADAASTLRSLLSRSGAGEGGVSTVRPIRLVSAAVTYLETAVTSGIVAVGDASYAVDPLSGQGVAKALDEGLMLGQVVSTALDGDLRGIHFYEAQRRQRLGNHLRERKSYYSAARRANNPFWAKRC
ncbi:NAD(P)/FAD-dependent oxidoreductase [Burkholderia cepacia]|uniref:NAD(P)/FAD-dependent oxidoreductase n=1 Tax=Burkholderia cepacia TaxID=292 RepID=UPI001CF41CAF|nr:tryptophan 7-halogenase [Burkholderia cepacia]MCA7893462.1 tryptophan 7-halogenase [Burkholderia cepacia]